MRTNGVNTKSQPQQVDERRQWGRYAMPATDVLITLGEETRRGRLVDESIGGIGVEVDNAMGMAANDQLELVYSDVPVQGTIKSIRETESGKYHVGIGWQDWRVKEERSRRSISSAQYILSNGMSLLCQPVEPRPDGKVAVRLWDGARFEVAADQVITNTVEKRKEQLQALERELNVLDGLYCLGQPGSRSELIEAILDFEFSGNNLLAG